MKKLKLYETFRSDSENLSFRDDQLGKNVDVWIRNPYPAIKGGSVISGVCEWTAELDLSSSGIDALTTTLKSIRFVIELEENEETGEIGEVEIEVPQIDPDQCEREDLYEFPLYLRSIDIDMRHTEEKEYWTYSYSIGTIEY